MEIDVRRLFEIEGEREDFSFTLDLSDTQLKIIVKYICRTWKRIMKVAMPLSSSSHKEDRRSSSQKNILKVLSAIAISNKHNEEKETEDELDTIKKYYHDGDNDGDYDVIARLQREYNKNYYK